MVVVSAFQLVLGSAVLEPDIGPAIVNGSEVFVH